MTEATGKGLLLRNALAVVLLVIIINVGFAFAQEVDPLATGIDETIQAQDGKVLYGSYFSESESDSPAVLLLHQLYTNRSSWTPVITPLLSAGFKVLAVDLRGYGKTRGDINWSAAQNDTVSWSDWLKQQPGVRSIVIMGSSMGSNLALVGCAVIENCAGAVAISPSLDYFGVKTSDAMQAGFPSLIIYAEKDRYPRQDVPHMLELADDHAATIIYSGRTHGMALFKEHDDLMPQIVQWLQAL
jgi:dienelactone hydrolase